MQVLNWLRGWTALFWLKRTGYKTEKLTTTNGCRNSMSHISISSYYSYISNEHGWMLVTLHLLFLPHTPTITGSTPFPSVRSSKGRNETILLQQGGLTCKTSYECHWKNFNHTIIRTRLKLPTAQFIHVQSNSAQYQDAHA